MKKAVDKIFRAIGFYVAQHIAKDERELVLLGRMIANQNTLRTDAIIRDIQSAEFKVFSQFGDDGIIQFLVNYLDLPHKTFVEFGVEDYRESNTRFLMVNNNWKGLIMDGSEENMRKVVSSGYYWRYDLTAKKLFVDKDNINAFIAEQGFAGRLGLLHIDIDGNDYWLWKAIDAIDPTIVIMEYNSVFGSEKPWTVPYDKDFQRTKAHSSNLFWGSSILSLCDLAEEKGYIFIGTNSAGNNAYFIKKGFEKGLRALAAKEGYTLSRYRESRDPQGRKTFISGPDRLKALKGTDVFNTRTNKLEKI